MIVDGNPAGHCSSRAARLAGLASLAGLACAAMLAGCQGPRPIPSAQAGARYLPQALHSLPPIADADWLGAWPAWLASCASLAPAAGADWKPGRAAWRPACERAAAVDAKDAAAIRGYFADTFDLYRIEADGEGRDGLLTGYYEPLLQGSRVRDERHTVPLYGVPADLVRVDLADVAPQLKGLRLRGRLERSGDGLKLVPYWSRAQIDALDPLRGDELLWVDDALAAFFLQVQGSGRVELAGGGQLRLAYADTNGQPYRSIGRWLVDRGEMTLEQVSLQSITQWARDHPDRVAELLAQNPSVVFFRELPVGDPDQGPAGALGAPLTPGYSVAADARYVPAGAPLAIDATATLSGSRLARPVVAQDSGGAIRGPLRLDLFWGIGPAAAEAAGRQHSPLAVWLWLPKGADPAALMAP